MSLLTFPLLGDHNQGQPEQIQQIHLLLHCKKLEMIVGWVGPHIRLIPLPTPGSLTLATSDDGTEGDDRHQKIYLLTWQPGVPVTSDRGETVLTSAPAFSLPTSSILSINVDEPSLTLFITTDRPIRGQTAFAFHPFDMSDDANIAFFSLLSPLTTRLSRNDTEDGLLGVLEKFSRVTRFYRDSALYLLTGEDNRRRPRRQPLLDDGPSSPPINPWLRPMEIELPPSRRLSEPSNIPLGVPTEIFRMLLFTGGSQDDQRPVNWSRLFALEDGSETEYDDYVSLGHLVSEETKTRILKDVLRTDRTDPFYLAAEAGNDPDHDSNHEHEHDIASHGHDNEEDECVIERNLHLRALYQMLLWYASEHAQVDYVQGMHDIASPILMTMKGDARAAYAIFTRIMDKHHQVFYFEEGSQWTSNQLALLSEMLAVADPHLHDRLAFTADNAALFIAYRWLLLLFKREVGLRDAPLLLETIVAAPTERYELFIALAMLLAYRDKVLSFGHRFDQTLQFYATRAGNHDTPRLLSLADQWHQYFFQTASLRHDPRFAPLRRLKEIKM